MLGAQAGEQRHAVVAGQHHVEHGDVGAQVARDAHRLVGVAGGRGAAAVEAQRGRHEVGEVGLVVDDEHADGRDAVGRAQVALRQVGVLGACGHGHRSSPPGGDRRRRTPDPRRWPGAPSTTYADHPGSAANQRAPSTTRHEQRGGERVGEGAVRSRPRWPGGRRARPPGCAGRARARRAGSCRRSRWRRRARRRRPRPPAGRPGARCRSASRAWPSSPGTLPRQARSPAASTVKERKPCWRTMSAQRSAAQPLTRPLGSKPPRAAQGSNAPSVADGASRQRSITSATSSATTCVPPRRSREMTLSSRKVENTRSMRCSSATHRLPGGVHAGVGRVLVAHVERDDRAPHVLAARADRAREQRRGHARPAGDEGRLQRLREADRGVRRPADPGDVGALGGEGLVDEVGDRDVC